MKCVGLHDDTVSILIGGEAGQGITRSGAMLGKALASCGLHAFGVIDYPSLIRGGHNFYVVRVCEREIFSNTSHVDLIVALNEETVMIHQHELVLGGGIIVDSDISFDAGELRDDIKTFAIPLTKIVKELGGPQIMRNTVALGGAMGLIGLKSNELERVVVESFSGREKIAVMNRDAVAIGYSYASDNFEGFGCSIEEDEKKPEMLWVTGNEAISLGALQADCKFYAAYPMTPASPILHYLINRDEEAGMVVVQPESELAAICMVIGASYGGVRAMTATSGGGFSLMVEALGLAGMTEIPVVIMLGQRPGPSTGMATYTAQGDLLFSIYAGQGEFPRVVVAPGNVDQCFYQAVNAFNLAEKFQVPVIFLTDKHLLEGHKTTVPWNFEGVPFERGKLILDSSWDEVLPYKRFKLTSDGVSPRLIPGTFNALKLSNSNEHDEYGFTTIDPGLVVSMVNKRMKKIPHIVEAVNGLGPVRVYGVEEPDISLFVWGSTTGPARESLSLLEDEGVKGRVIQILFLEPFPKEDLEPLLKGKEPKMILENNRTGQLDKLIKLKNGYTFKNSLHKFDGRQFFPEEIRDRVKEVLK